MKNDKEIFFTKNSNTNSKANAFCFFVENYLIRADCWLSARTALKYILIFHFYTNTQIKEKKSSSSQYIKPFPLLLLLFSISITITFIVHSHSYYYNHPFPFPLLFFSIPPLLVFLIPIPITGNYHFHSILSLGVKIF